MASQTSILKLALIDGSDFISPTPFNANFTALDRLGKDYVTECDTNGSWWYRKWASGLAECGIQHHNCGTITTNKSWGANLVYADVWEIGSYPFTFSSPPTIVVSQDGPTNYYSLHTLSPSSSPSSIGPTVSAVEPYTRTISGIYMSCYAVGRCN